MKTERPQSRWSRRLGASLCAFLMCFSTSAAYANPDRVSAHLNNLNARENWRAARIEARGMRNENRQNKQHHIMSRGASVDNLVQPVMPVGTPRVEGVSNAEFRGNNSNVTRHTNHSAGDSVVLYPGQISSFHTSRPHHFRTNSQRLGRSTYINDRGNEKNLSRWMSLDLSSTNTNITVGSNLLDGKTSILVGGETREIGAGSKVTAAEYAALNQKLATGSQGLTLTEGGAASGGSLNLNLVSNDGNTIHASELVVPENVKVTGDFGRAADGVKVTKDLVNHGSIFAISTDASKHTATIAARDINNEIGGLISTQSTAENPVLNLSLRADHDLNNKGSITSSGDLELSAGRLINNQGSISSDQNITLNSAPDTKLTVNNSGGTISATNGDINVRTADYTGTADSTVYGGNLYSKQLNLHSGSGTTNVRVNELTGVVNSTGTAAHVNANTGDLVLGAQCLTGDPTYYNTGNIILGGDINVDETLAIIAGGNITTTVTNLTINTRGASNQGHDINMIAGANITAGTGEISPAGGPATLPAQTQPGSITQNATAQVTVSGGSATGGSIDLTGATGSLTIRSSSSGTNFNGANVTLAAFSGSDASSGKILTGTTVNHQIFAGGNGTGNNGNVSIIGGATSGQGIQFGAIHTDSGTGQTVGTGNVVISNSQPTTSNSNPITFSITGSITSGNTIIPSATVGAGSVSIADTDSIQNISITSGGTTNLPLDISSQFDRVSVFSAGDLTVNRIFRTQAGTVDLLGQADITFFDTIRADDGILVVASGDLITGVNPGGAPEIFTDKSANTGNVSVIAGAAFNQTANSVTVTGASSTGGSILFDLGDQIQNLRATSSGGNGSGGQLNIIAYGGVGTGKIHLPTSFAFDVNSSGNGTGANGNINVIAGSNTADAIIMGGATAVGGNTNNTGNIYISSSAPGTLVSLSTAANFGGISSGTFQGGAISANGGVDINRTVATSSAQVTINAGAGGASFNDVSLFKDFQVNSLGDILVAGGTAVVKGDGDGQNTMLWTALGDISFSTRILLHGSGGGTVHVGGGGGVALIAGGTVQTIDNPNPGFSDASIETSSGYDGGNITVVAGASFNRVGNTVTITGSSGSGGSILFDGTAVGGFTGRNITHIDAHSQGGTDPSFLDGGDITLISFNDLKMATTGNFFSAAGSSFNVPPPVFGSNGNVTVVAPGSIVLAKIDMADDQGGSITIRAATPGVSTSIDVTPGTLQSFGNVTAGSFTNGALSNNNFNFSGGVFNTDSQSVSLNIATSGAVTLGNLDVHSTTANVAGGSITVQSGGNVSVGTINTSNTAASGDAGDITIISNSATTLNIGGGGANGSGNLTANASGTVGNGGAVVITNSGSGGITIGAGSITSNVTDGDGASLILDAGTGNLNITSLGATVSRNAAGANNDGGAISLTYGSLTAAAGAITLSANGTGTGGGGSVAVRTTTGAGNLTIGNAAGNFLVSASGTGGLIDFHAGGTFTLAATGSANADDVRLFSTGAMTINNAITADPITMICNATININGDLTANGGILIVSGGNVNTNIALDINASNATGNGGNVVIAAGAAFTETDDDVTITGASATGGSVDFTVGGGSLASLNTNSSFAGGSGGRLTLLAYQGAGAGTGRVTLSPITTSTGGSGPGSAGSATVIGGATSGNAISMGGISTNSGLPGSGPITLAAAQPNAGAGVTILKDDASYAGSFTGGASAAGNIGFAVFQTGASAVTITGGGSITGQEIDTIGGAVTMSTGAAGGINITGAGIDTSGFLPSIPNGGDVTLTSGTGGLTVTGGINADGSSTGSGGDGGTVLITTNLNGTPVNLTISAIGQGTAGNGGNITVINNGTGGITVDNNDYAITGAGAGGTLTFDTTGGPVDGVITFNGGVTITANGNGANSAGTFNFLASQFAVTGGGLTLQATGGAANTGHIAMGAFGGVVTNGQALTFNAGGNISVNGQNGINTSANTPGAITMNAGLLVNTSDIVADSTGGGGNGAIVSITAGTTLDVNNVSSNGNGAGNGGSVSLVSTGSSVNFQSISNTGTVKGQTTLTATNASITTFGAETIDSGILNVNLLGGTPGSFAPGGTQTIITLNGTGGGLINIDNGANAINLGTLGATQSLVLTTSNVATGIVATQNINTTGTITLTTPRLFNNQVISAQSILVQNPTGNLTVDGGAGGTLTGTTPPNGPPSTPSIPGAVIIQTNTGANLTLNGMMTFNGDVELNNYFGITTSSAGSLFQGNDNVSLNTATWNQVGGGNITGNNLIVNLVPNGTIVNTDGDVTFTGNVVLNGIDFAIIARDNINLGTMTINLSGLSGGDLSLIAGYNFTTSSSGQTFSPLPFTFSTPSTNGGDINASGLTIITSATTGTGGDVLAVARGGSITLGTINTSATTGTGGNVTLIGENGITVGNINTTGTAGSGDVLLSVSAAQVVGTPVVTNGVLSGGTFVSGLLPTNGDITTAAINAGRGAIGMSTSGAASVITINGALTGNAITLNSDNGSIDFTTTNTISAQQDTAGNGGMLDFRAQNIIAMNSFAAPFNLSANGIGTGSGGTVRFHVTQDLTPTFIGAPASAPKGAARFLTLSAISGNAGGDGGTIDVLTGGNLTATPAAMTAGPQAAAGDWDGATYILNAGSAGTKGGSLVVTGDLKADRANNGDGGVIDLTTRSTKAFVLNPTKTPKNGVAGTLSAAGFGGNIRVTNTNGGITVSTSGDLSADHLDFTTGGKGVIGTSSGVVITASESIDFTANTGAIGKKPLFVDTQALTANTLGTVNITNNSLGTTLGDSSGGRSFVLNTVGPLTVNDINVANGSLTLVTSATSGGMLAVANGATLTANNGSLTLQNLDTTNGDITIGDGATVETQGKGRAVTIVVGLIPKQPTLGTQPGGVSITGTGGTAFFGPGGVSVPVGTATVSLKNEDVIFNVTGGRNIFLGNGSTIEADPPAPVKGSEILANNVATAPTESMLNSLASLTVTPTINQTSLTNSIETSATLSSQLAGLNNISLNAGEPIAEVSDQGNGLIVNAAFHADKEVGLSNFNVANSSNVRLVQSNNKDGNSSFVSKQHVLKQGNVVFAPSTDTTIDTAHGTVKIAKGSLTLVIENETGLAVYNLDDRKIGSVSIQAHGAKHTLSPGQHVLISSHQSEQFEDVNAIELIQHRGLKKVKLTNGWNVFVSEFSIPSACFAVKPLSALISSKHKGAQKIAQNMLKTSAILMTLSPDRGDFVQYFKPKTMALLK